MIEFPTEAEFLAWRAENPHRGVPLFAGHCPLAECLRDRGAPAPEVYDDWTVDDSNPGRKTPAWAMAWLREYDAESVTLEIPPDLLRPAPSMP